MSGFFRPNQYIKRNWDMSFYRPKKMASTASLVNQEISSTCNNLRSLADDIQNLSQQLKSSDYSSDANAIIKQIGYMNTNLSRTASAAINDLIRICSIIASKNKTLANKMNDVSTQMLNDELRHVVLQSDTLHRISKNRNKVVNKLIRKIRIFVMKLTTFVVWHKYKELFLKGDYEYKKFKKHSIEYLKESIYIEKTRKMDF